MVRFQARPFHTYRTSLQQAESMAKSPFTLEIALSAHSFTCCGQLNYIATLRGRRMSSSIPVVVLRIEHKQSKIGRPRGFKLTKLLYKCGRSIFNCEQRYSCNKELSARLLLVIRAFICDKYFLSLTITL